MKTSEKASKEMNDKELAEAVTGMAAKIDNIIPANTELGVLFAAMALIIAWAFKSNGDDEEDVREAVDHMKEMAVVYFSDDDTPTLN
jgi:hypothetical protein